MAGETPSVLLNAEFATDPAKEGWVRAAFGKQEFSGAWHRPDSAGNEPGHLAVKRGYWQTPDLKVKPLAYYRLRFAARTPQPAYWSAVFVDAAGAEIVADVYDSIDTASAWQKNEFCFRAHALATKVRLRFQPIAEDSLRVSNVSLEDVDAATAGEWIDGIAANNPLLRFSPAAERWGHLPKTMQKLKEGGMLKIVLLGDSIANDSSNSMFEIPLLRKYPKAKIEVITSVRGGTGCQYYKDENRVQDYVCRFKPDLLVIAGISNGYDAEAIRSVIKQVRASIDPEILVLSGAICPEELCKKNHVERAKNKGEALEQVEKFRSRLARMTHEEKVEFFDIRAVWDQYIRLQNHPQEWFMRDPIHANSRGKQVVGRILLKYFEPKEEE
ncbi:MAG TPA: SGNH/GDSL hydrolase family protein [Planctomycetota bacterium]